MAIINELTTDEAPETGDRRLPRQKADVEASTEWRRRWKRRCSRRRRRRRERDGVEQRTPFRQRKLLGLIGLGVRGRGAIVGVSGCGMREAREVVSGYCGGPTRPVTVWTKSCRCFRLAELRSLLDASGRVGSAWARDHRSRGDYR